MKNMRAILPFLTWGALLVLATPAMASFTLCNRTNQEMETAFARREHDQWISEGWWRIPPQQCVKIFSTLLTQRFYYYYARTTTQPLRVWGGKYKFCSNSIPFLITGDDDCQKRNYGVLGFAQIDVGERNQFVLDFHQ